MGYREKWHPKGAAAVMRYARGHGDLEAQIRGWTRELAEKQGESDKAIDLNDPLKVALETLTEPVLPEDDVRPLDEGGTWLKDWLFSLRELRSASLRRRLRMLVALLNAPWRPPRRLRRASPRFAYLRGTPVACSPIIDYVINHGDRAVEILDVNGLPAQPLPDGWA